MPSRHVVAAFLLIAGPAFSQTVEYQCTFPAERAAGGGWIPEIVAIRDEGGSRKVTVFDPLIREIAGSPISGKLGEETKGRVVYQWELRVKSLSQSATTMRYRLTYYRNGRPAAITGSPAGYDNQFSGTGTCKLKTSNP